MWCQILISPQSNVSTNRDDLVLCLLSIEVCPTKMIPKTQCRLLGEVENKQQLKD